MQTSQNLWKSPKMKRIGHSGLEVKHQNYSHGANLGATLWTLDILNISGWWALHRWLVDLTRNALSRCLDWPCNAATCLDGHQRHPHAACNMIYIYIYLSSFPCLCLKNWSTQETLTKTKKGNKWLWRKNREKGPLPLWVPMQRQLSSCSFPESSLRREHVPNASSTDSDWCGM